MNVFNENIDPFKDAFVGALPVQVVFPGIRGKLEFHSSSFRLVPPVDLSSAIDSSRRRAFFGLRSK